jgi:hypothetical protein
MPAGLGLRFTRLKPLNAWNGTPFALTREYAARIADAPATGGAVPDFDHDTSGEGPLTPGSVEGSRKNILH